MNKVRTYSCATCGGPVNKPACEAPPKPENPKGKHKPQKQARVEYHGLGGWRCDSCGPTKVKVEMKAFNPNPVPNPEVSNG